ncbi:unnamed protein product [Periconia digitata]|uniref:Uncharacterized protein n=1 Tax=Periconia digitata TaxID=1303443 RepID=A0A9W4UNK2_9PLEO|nr:unnamed protein product [Periconia digitata]
MDPNPSRSFPQIAHIHQITQTQRRKFTTPQRALYPVIHTDMLITLRRWWSVIKGSFRDAKNDLRCVFPDFKCWVAALLGCILIGGLVTAFTWLSWLYSDPAGTFNACPYGEFNVFPELESPWTATGFLQITMSFGRLSFGQAKAIDVCWDIIIGRGGQAALAYISWRTFAYYVTTSMEVAPITYSSFRTIFVETSPGIYSTARLIRDFTTRKGLHSRIAMIFIIYSAILTLLFSTLASAMTGYTVNNISQMRDYQSNSVNFTQFKILLYTIHDGDRVGLTRDFLVTSNPMQDYEPVVVGGRVFPPEIKDPLFDTVDEYVIMNVRDFHNPSNTTSYYGHYNEIKLEPPELNISKHFGKLDGPEESRGLKWEYKNEVYPLDYISKNGLCQSTKDYAWGFSLILLFAVMGALLLWSIGISSMYMHSKRIMNDIHRISLDGEHKAIIRLFLAMHQELNLDFHSLRSEEDLSEHELSKLVQKIDGGSISYSSPIFWKRTGYKIRIREIRWWLGAFIILLAITIFLPLIVPIEHAEYLGGDNFYIRGYVWSTNFGPLLGTFLSCLIGTKTGSRVVITSVLTLVFCLAWIPIVVPNGKSYCAFNRSHFGGDDLECLLV